VWDNFWGTNIIYYLYKILFLETVKNPIFSKPSYNLYKIKMIPVRKSNTAALWDTDGNGYEFDTVESGGGRKIHVAKKISGMSNRSIPVGPIFNLFGRNVTIKYDYDPVYDECMLTVIDSNVYSAQSSNNKNVITYHRWETEMSKHKGCEDLVIGKSFNDNTELTVAPLVPTSWSSLPLMSKIYRALVTLMVISTIAALVVFKGGNTPLKDFTFCVLMLFKEYILYIITLF